MIQAGPVANVHMPKDKVTGVHQGFGFVEFRSEDDAEYAIKASVRVRVPRASAPRGRPVRAACRELLAWSTVSLERWWVGGWEGGDAAVSPWWVCAPLVPGLAGSRRACSI